MQACPYGPDWDNLVKAVGKFEAYKDYLQFNGEIRTPEEVLSKLEVSGFTQSIISTHRYQLEAAPNTISSVKKEVLETMVNGLTKKFSVPHAYKIVNEPSVNWKGKVVPYDDPDALDGKPTILINAAKASIDTPLHEFGHIFIKMIQTENTGLYYSLVNQLFDRKVVNGQDVYEIKEKYAERYNALKKRYPDLKDEELEEEFIVELMGQYASEYYDSTTGEFKASYKSNDSLLASLAKTLKNIWDAIKDILFSNTGIVNIYDISPATPIEEVSILLAIPELKFQNLAKVPQMDLKEVAPVKNEFNKLIAIRDAINSGVKLYPISYEFQRGTIAKLIFAESDYKKIQNAINKTAEIRNYFATGTATSDDKAFFEEYKRNKKSEKDLDTFNKILDQPKYARLKWFLNGYSNKDFSFIIEEYDSDNYLFSHPKARLASSFASFNKENFYEFLSSPGSSYDQLMAHQIFSAFDISPALSKEVIRGSQKASFTRESVAEDVDRRIKKLKKIIDQPSSLKQNRSISFEIQVVNPKTGKTTTDKITVSANLDSRGWLNTQFDTAKWGMRDPFWFTDAETYKFKKPKLASGRNSLKGLGTKVRFKKSDDNRRAFGKSFGIVDVKYDDPNNDNRASYVVIEADDTSASLIEHYTFFDWYEAFERNDQRNMDLLEDQIKTVPLSELDVEIAQEGRSTQVMGKVATELAALFADIPYKGISFVPMSGESLIRESGEMRLKLYNNTAKRLFGKWSVVKASDNTTMIPMPASFKGGVDLQQVFYQKEETSASSVDEFAKEGNNSIATIGLEEVKPAIVVDPKADSNSQAVGLAKAFALSLSLKLGVEGKPLNYQFITADDARNLTKDKTNPWNGQKAFFLGDTVYFVGDNINLATVFHEFSHPFVRTIFLQNRKLFDKLFNDIMATPEGQALYEEVKAAYPELGENDALLREEMIVRTLTKASKLESSGAGVTKTFGDVVRNILYAIKQALRKLLGKNINISKLGVNTSISELAYMLKNSEGIMLDPAALEEIDTVAYEKDINSYMEDMAKISRPDLMGMTVQAHDIAIKQIKIVTNNKNYSEMLSILADQYSGGELKEIRNNLSKYTRNLEDKMREMRDQVEYNRAHTIAMLNTWLRLEKMVQKINRHMQLLSEDPNSIDNMHKAYYYDYLLRYWDDYLAEVERTMDAAQVSPSSPLSNLVGSIRRNIESSRKYSKKMYKDGVKDVLYNELRTMAENLDKKYAGIIDNLEKSKAPKGIIDKWYEEYYGLTSEEKQIYDDLTAAKKSGVITPEQTKRLEFLRRKSLNGAQITEEKIELALTGEYKDANIFSSFFEGYLYNTDPVVGGFALYVKNQVSDAMNKAMTRTNDYLKDLTPLLEKAGYTPSNPSGLIEKIGRKEFVGKVDEDGNFVKKEIWTFKSIHKDWRLPLDEAQYEIDKAHRDFAKYGTAEAEKILLEKIGDKKKLLKDYFYQEYIQEVYAKDNMLEKGYRVVDGVDIGLEAAYKKDRIFERMKELSTPATTAIEELDKVSEEMEKLWREYYQLYSFVDINGKLKKGTDYEIAKLLKEYKEASKDPKTGESYFEFKLRPNGFQAEFSRFEEEAAQKYKNDPAKYRAAIARWVKKNTRTVVKEEFYKERKKILDAIDELMSRIPDSEAKKLNTTKLWNSILDIVSGNRDEDGQPIGTNFTEKGAAFIKKTQEEIQEAMKKFAGISGLSEIESAELSLLFDKIKNKTATEQDRADLNILINKKEVSGLSNLHKQKLFSLFADLKELQKKEATAHYCDVMNNWLSKLNTGLMMNELGTNNINQQTADLLLEEGLINSLLNQNEEFRKWFEANHYRRTIYDPVSNSKKDVWERIYIWNVVKPNDEDYYEKSTVMQADGTELPIDGLPSLKYYYRVIKPQYRTQRIVGVTVDNQGNFLPREDVPNSPFIDQDYLDMKKNDPAHFAILEKMKEHHLKNQENLSFKARLYLDIPRFRKNALEVLRTKKLKVVAGDIGEEKLPILSLLIERFKNIFRKTKDQMGSEYNWEDDAILGRADMFDNESVNVPILGLSDLEINDVSPDINQSLIRYMFSAERHKKLVEINPVAQALKATVNDPANMAKQLDRINKFNFIHRGIITYLNKKGRYTRQAAVNNFIEREFEGMTDAGITKDLPTAQSFASFFNKRASFAFFALNIPSALKNMMSAKWASMIHSVGGADIDPVSLTKGEGWAFGAMSTVTAQIYKRGTRPLNIMIMDSFDAIGDRMEQKLPEAMSRTFLHDMANFSWLNSFRKWTQDEAELQLFAAMMYKKKLTQNGKEIDYMNAWEQVDGQLKLKDGIDIRWNNLPTEHTISKADTLETVAARYNMSKEDLEKELKGQSFKEGRTIKIDNRLYKDFKNRFSTIKQNLNGAYSKFDQPEAYRYLAYRQIAFLKRFFTTMFMNRWGFSGTFTGAKRGRVNYGMGDIHEGYYVSTLKMLYRMARFGTVSMAHFTPEEKAAFKKTIAEWLAVWALLAIIAPLLGWDPDDEERFEKLKQRSGDMPFFGLVPEDPDHPFNMMGYFHNSLLKLVLDVRSETETFIPWMGYGLDNQYEIFTDVSSLGFGPTLGRYKSMLEYLYADITGGKEGTYQKDAGPYYWQKEGGSKALTEFWKSLGLTGSSISPTTAIKANPQISG